MRKATGQDLTRRRAAQVMTALIVLAASSAATSARRAAGNMVEAKEAVHESQAAAPEGFQAEGAYDIRVAAEGYAQILGVLAGFALTAIVFVLGAQRDKTPTADTTFAVGLLGVAFIGCTFSAFNYAGLSGGVHLTPRVLAAVNIAGLGTAIAAVSIFGGFTVLASEYLRSDYVVYLFGAGTGLAGLTAIIYLSFNIPDTLRTCGLPDRTTYPDSPTVPDDVEAGRRQQRLITLVAVAWLVALAVPAVLVHIDPRGHLASEGFIVSAAFLTTACSLWSVHHADPRERSDGRLGGGAALVLLLIVATYTGGLLNLLPIEVL